MAKAIRVVEALQERGLLRGNALVKLIKMLLEVIAKEIMQNRSRYGSVDYAEYWVGRYW
ncbi:hypothetical protein [Photobacterium leiognathi]|uniref:hypothetical protein n=1 Tax=Photobacterium leiognathi TaxID=553611 RepID=UPI0027346F16|nr:hypothetical protein [Photobacterium leiognathi]